MTKTTIVRPADPALRAAVRLAVIFAAIKLIFTFALTLWTSHIGYGYFRDEFYYIACGRHLAWGYVDHGPIVAIQARVGEWLFGDSIFGIRVLSAFAGAATIALGGLLTWVMGGRRSAQALAMFALLVTPQYIGIDGFLSMNSFEPVFWMICVLALLLILHGYSERLWWVVFGVSAGLGLLNKPSMTFFLIALGLGLLCTSSRRILSTRWAAAGVALLVVIALPNLLWQVHHQWPTLEFLRDGKLRHKNAVLDPLHFFLAQVLMLQPTNIILWVPGAISLLRARSIRDGRWLGVAYIFFYVMMNVLHAKDYYLDGIYPAIFAAGAIAWERYFAASRSVLGERIIAFPIFETWLLVTSVIILPMASPVLRPDTWVRYTSALHLHNSKQENMAEGPLPQFFADRFGWQQEVDIVVQAYRTLTPDEQRRVCIFGGNYGEAGAIDFLAGRQQDHMPPAMSGHNTYWMWGTHGCDPNIVIAVIHDTPAEVSKKYESVNIAGVMNQPYAMPFEHKNIYILRRHKASAPFHWADEKDYI
jgi:hypothetical protein